jgi:hypothetical protein
LYASLTDFIPLIKNIMYGKWYPEEQTGDGSAEHSFQSAQNVFVTALCRGSLRRAVLENGWND